MVGQTVAVPVGLMARLVRVMLWVAQREEVPGAVESQVFADQSTSLLDRPTLPLPDLVQPVAPGLVLTVAGPTLVAALAHPDSQSRRVHFHRRSRRLQVVAL